jgi:hypothetical protein
MKGLTSGVSIRYYSYQFGALPTQFSTLPSSDPYHWSFYATLNPAPTISSVSLSNNSLTAAAPAGTVIGAISVTMSSGSFTGSLALSGANASSFKIVGSNLQTNGVLPAGSYNINIVATQSGAANSPFTQAETTLGPLGLGGIVPINNPTATAQYGAVEWLAVRCAAPCSSPPATPLSSDSRWSSNNGSFPNSAANSYIPPVSLSGVSHSDSVYLWVMDSANHISAAASQVVP